MSDSFEDHFQERRRKFINGIKTTGEQNKQRIIDCIIISMPNGRSTSELTQETNLDRDTIYSHCKEMIDEGIIVKQGKFKKYKITAEFYKNPLHVAQSLMTEVFQDPSFRTPYLTLNEEFISDKLFKEFAYLINQDPDFFKNAKNRAKMDTILMYEFVNRIGAIITILIIYAFQFSRHSLYSLGHRTIRSNMMENRRQQQKAVDGNLMDKIITDWVSRALQPIAILNEFIRFMNSARGLIYGEDILRVTKKVEKNNSDQWSFYEIGQVDNQKFIDAIAAVYPDIFNIIEHIAKKKLPKKIDDELERYNRRARYLSCSSHIFRTETIENILYYTCSRCGVRYKVKPSDIVTNHELISKLNKESRVKIKGIKSKKCGEQDHIWIRSLAPDRTKNIFECIRCSRSLSLYAESKEKLDKIKELIPLRFSTENDMSLCNLIQKFFYDQSNKAHSFNELSEYVKSCNNKFPDRTRRRERNDHNILDASTITKKLRPILKFLVDQSFLSLETSGSIKNDSLSHAYIHKSLINWR